MQRQGTCFSFTGVQNKKCKAGVEYRPMVGGDDFGWLTRLPCTKGNGTECKCDQYREPTPEEIERGKREWKEAMAATNKVIAHVREVTGAEPQWETMDEHKDGYTGTMDYPKCGQPLNYSVSPGNHHIHAFCTSGGCITFMM